ncbi:ribonuclease H [Senna tora]|uniref:Ribonuclease H n=1 Tax=Senna tora TaxID=362788 RepID=A0A834TW77_9FABA|nr:ribonuclease H [Senna tora]
MNFLIWNCRGTASRSFPGLIRDLKRKFRVDFLALIETHQEGTNAQRIVNKFGFNHREMVEAVGHSGGIWCMWNECGHGFQVVLKHDQFIHFKVMEGSHIWFLTVVYGSSRVAQRRELWNCLNILGASISDPWCIVGDFNAFLFGSEKTGGSSQGSRPDRHFLNMVDSNSLVDLGYSGPGFTWKRSDHSPILLRLHGDSGLGTEKNRPFRFLASWLLHDDFQNVVRNSWQGDWYWSLNCFQDKVKIWNREVFGNIFRKKDQLLRRLQGIHNKLCLGPSIFLSNLQEELWVEYENVLMQEEILWMQKSREQWIVNGDCNTRFFHTSTMIRRRRNKIEALKDDQGEWIYNAESLKNMAVQFYGNLYGNDVMNRRAYDLAGFFPALCEREAKYKCGDDLIPKVGRSRSASRLWNGISVSWDFVQEGLVWRMGDGRKVRFWSDAWLPNGNALCTYALSPLSEFDLSRVAADFVSASGDWEWSKFDFLLPNEVCNMIAAVPPPSNVVRGDHLAWKHSKDGSFSTKSAYHAISHGDVQDGHRFWNLLWKWKGMEKIRSFLWLCGHDRLLTNVARKRRGIAATDVCTRCNNAPEDLLHTLMDCPKAKSIWLKLVHPGKWHIFFSASSLDWLTLNLSSNLGSSRNDWDVVFAISCWYIWRMRNAEIFYGSRVGTADPVMAILKWASDSIRAMDKNVMGGYRCDPSVVDRFICWNKPEFGWVKFNVDGARKDSLNLTTCGGVARDSSGRFLFGFVRDLGDGTVLNAELWGILSALEVSWHKGFKKIVVESDCLVAVKLVNDLVQMTHPCSAILSQIHHWATFDWEVRFVHVHREGNYAADALAAYAFSRPLGLHVLEAAPICLHQCLLDDLAGRGCHRLCGG